MLTLIIICLIIFSVLLFVISYLLDLLIREETNKNNGGYE